MKIRIDGDNIRLWLLIAIVAAAILALLGMSVVQQQVRRQPLSAIITDLKTSIPRQYSFLTIQPPSSNQVGRIAYAASKSKALVLANDMESAVFTFRGGGAAAPLPGYQHVAKALTSAAERLRQSGFHQVANPPINLYSMASNSGYSADDAGYYVRGSEVCLLGNWAALMTIGCTTDAALNTVADQIKPFAAAYADQPPGEGLIRPFFGEPAISNATGSYRYALVPIGDANNIDYQAGAFFYTDISGRTWHYFASSQEGLTCNNISSNSDAKVALAAVCNDGAY